VTARDPKQLLGGYATDSLHGDERNDLMRAALDDQELFDALVEEEGLRELLSDPGARQEVLAVLEQPSGWERFRAWFERPATLGDLASIGALAIVAVFGLAVVLSPTLLRSRVGARPTGSTLHMDQVKALAELPEKQVVPAGIEIQGRADARFAPGEMVPLRISLRAPARVFVIASDLLEQAWPALGQPPASVSAPEGGGPAILSATVVAAQTPGTQRLRLVVAPDNLDLGTLTPEEIQARAPRLTLVDVRYEVKQR
jgi:hypothetical protein